MVTTTQDGITQVRGNFLGESILIYAMNREQAHKAQMAEMERIWLAKGYVLPSKGVKQ